MEFNEDQQAHIDQLLSTAKMEWETSILSPIITERDELLQYKPQQETEHEKEIKKLKAELMHQKVVATLKEADLEDFSEFLQLENEEELQNTITKLSTVLDARKINSSFEPDNKRTTSTYDNAASKKDAVGMIGAKFSKLFQ